MTELSEDKKRAVELLCERPDLSKTEIAVEVGVSRQTLHRWQQEPDFASAMRAKGREPIPPADVREILNILIAQAKAKDTAAAKLLFAWQARADGGPELAEPGETVINFIVGAEDGKAIDDGQTKALMLVIANYLTRPSMAREDLRKELQDVLSGEAAALLPAPEEMDKMKTLPRAEPDVRLLLSPNPLSAGMEESRCGTETHTGATGILYTQAAKETKDAFWKRVTKYEMLEGMRENVNT